VLSGVLVAVQTPETIQVPSRPQLDPLEELPEILLAVRGVQDHSPDRSTPFLVGGDEVLVLLVVLRILPSHSVYCVNVFNIYRGVQHIVHSLCTQCCAFRNILYCNTLLHLRYIVPRSPTEMLIIYDLPDTDFTQVPNDLINCPHLSAAEKITWMQLASVCRNGEAHFTLRSLGDVAKALDVPAAKLRTYVGRLVRAGGAVKEQGGYRLTVPTQEAPEPTIQEEIQEQPNRKHSMTQKEAWELVKESWNKNKPESWLRLDGSMNLPVMIALETQAKRLEIQREQYGNFVGQVCRGATTDSWWSSQNMKASSVFGFSKVSDKKFENVEKLYKAGAAVESKIDYNCDADILARYHEKGHADRVRVIRLEAEDQFAAGDHLNSIPDEEYDPTAVYLYFAQGKERPVYWSLKSKRSTMYLFS